MTGISKCWVLSFDDDVTAVALSFVAFQTEHEHDFVTVYDGSDQQVFYEVRHMWTPYEPTPATLADALRAHTTSHIPRPHTSSLASW